MLQATAIRHDAVRPTVLIWKHLFSVGDRLVCDSEVCVVSTGFTENPMASLHHKQPKFKWQHLDIVQCKTCFSVSSYLHDIYSFQKRLRNIWETFFVSPGSRSEGPCRHRAGADLLLSRVGPSLNFNLRTLRHFKRLEKNTARLHWERNQLFTALMEWNANSSRLLTALFSSWAPGHYWLCAFFPSQANLLCRLDQNCAVSSPSFWASSHLTDDRSHCTAMSTYAGAGNWRNGTDTIVEELLSRSAPFSCACQSTMSLANSNRDQPKDLHALSLSGPHRFGEEHTLLMQDVLSNPRTWDQAGGMREREVAAATKRRGNSFVCRAIFQSVSEVGRCGFVVAPPCRELITWLNEQALAMSGMSRGAEPAG